MRDLNLEEVWFPCGGGDAPIGSPTAGSYFTKCMNYNNPNATAGAAITFASLIPVVGVYVAAAAVYAAGTVMTCGIGTIQYAQ